MQGLPLNKRKLPLAALLNSGSAVMLPVPLYPPSTSEYCTVSGKADPGLIWLSAGVLPQTMLLAIVTGCNDPLLK